MALPRPARLRKERDIKNVFRRSRRREGNFLILLIHQKQALPGRATVVVPKKVSKSAVVRNGLRRMLVEWLRVDVGVQKQPIDCVVLVKPSLKSASKESIRAELANLRRTVFA